MTRPAARPVSAPIRTPVRTPIAAPVLALVPTPVPRPLSWAELEWIAFCVKRRIAPRRCALWLGRSRAEVLQGAHAQGLYFTSARERQMDAWRRRRMRAYRAANRRHPLPLSGSQGCTVQPWCCDDA